MAHQGTRAEADLPCYSKIVRAVGKTPLSRLPCARAPRGGRKDLVSSCWTVPCRFWPNERGLPTIHPRGGMGCQKLRPSMGVFAGSEGRQFTDATEPGSFRVSVSGL